MNKQEFLAALARELEPLPREERYKTLNYYDELIDDRLEDGQEEEAVIQSLGDPRAVAQELLAGEDELLVPNRGLRVWVIVLLVLGFPLWGSLLVTAAVVLLCVFLCLFLPAFVLGVMALSLLAGAVLGVVVDSPQAARAKTITSARSSARNFFIFVPPKVLFILKLSTSLRPKKAAYTRTLPLER